MGFSLSDLDPTSASSAYGGVVRNAITKVPGGTAALGVVDQVAAREAENRARARAAGSTGAPPPYAPAFPSVNPMLIYAGIGLVLVLAVVLARK